MHLFHHILQEQLLVGGLHLRKVALDPVELWAVGHVEDLGDIQLLKEELRILGLVYAEVVEEEREVAAAELCRDLLDEREEDLGVDGLRMHQVVDEAALLADRSDHGQGRDLQVGVIDPNPLPVVGPALRPERAEGEHGLIKIENLGIRVMHLLQQCLHAMK